MTGSPAFLGELVRLCAAETILRRFSAKLVSYAQSGFGVQIGRGEHSPASKCGYMRRRNHGGVSGESASY